MLRDGARRLRHTRVSAPCELPTSHVRGFVQGTVSRTVEAVSQPSQQILRAAAFERDILSEQWRQSRQRGRGGERPAHRNRATALLGIAGRAQPWAGTKSQPYDACGFFGTTLPENRSS
jgi:hypothetical protein